MEDVGNIEVTIFWTFQLFLPHTLCNPNF
jgi:hypothetical protein